MRRRSVQLASPLSALGSLYVYDTRTYSNNRSKSANIPANWQNGTGGAVRIDAARKTDFIDCTFTGNKCDKSGGGAIWAEAPQRVGSARNVEFNLTDCTFLRNEMTVDNENAGGGALWIKGNKAPSGPAKDGVIHGTWSGCDFIENKGFKGGAIYMTSTALVEIEDCKFISNHSSKGGGAICVSDMEDITTTELLICNSDFIGNTADEKGGAVYNRGGSTTTMVNCIVAGNVANDLGGGTCNADDFVPPPVAPTTFDLHNCLLAGNLADTTGNQGGGHLNRDDGVSTLINCTVVLNVAVGNYGGIENGANAEDMLVRNCIVWGNSDDNPDGVDDQLHYTDGFNDGDVDKNVIEDCDDCFAGGENKDVDPDVVNTTSGMTWLTCTYDAATGITTFNITVNVSSFTNERLFRPDDTSPLQVLISSVDAVNDKILCYGNWVDLHGFSEKTGTIYDYHIASGSSAIDYGDSDYTPADDCDLDPTGPLLDVDLDLVDRGGNPDSGAYEDN